MPNYHVEYETCNEYGQHVGESFFSLQVLPCTNNYQTLNGFKIHNSVNEPYYITKNHYGFDQITFRSLKPFTQLIIRMSCGVHVKKMNPFDFQLLSVDEEMELLNSAEFQIENGFFLLPSLFTQIPSDLIKKEWHKNDDETVFEFLQRVNSLIHSGFEYLPNVTDVNHTAAEVLKIKKGVCQDFAHVFISIARSNKIPCRYVAGYINQGDNHIGSLQMHAWVEALIPNCGWIGFDPTNNILMDHYYIKVCHGIDYSECGSIRGILKVPEGTQSTNYTVKVTQQ